MPYVIVNDNRTPWFYYTGSGFAMTRPATEATEDPMQAQRFPDLRSAIDEMNARSNKSDLYHAGWRIVPEGE